MADLHILSDMPAALARFVLPTVTQWNRVEGRPRTQDFDRSLRAEVRDGLWMLTRQWQLGEFDADDAGAPTLVQMRVDHTRLTRAAFGADLPQPLVDELPLEARVERLHAALVRGGRKVGLDLRLLLGRQWLSMISAIGGGGGGGGAYADAYRAAYPISAPDPTDPRDSQICAHPAAYAMVSALAGRAMDGGDLYLHLLVAGNHAWEGVTGVAHTDRDPLDAAGVAFVAWFERLISQPDEGDDGAWTPDRLEYQFDCSAPVSADAAKVYTATEYASGRLDWWAMDVDAARTSLDDEPGPEDDSVLGFEVRTVIPAPVQFDGMPDPRWWAFEDGKINFGSVSAATTDLAKLLFLDFALVYGNDWFVVPFTTPAATVATVTGCAVTTTFGERFWITPAAQGRDDDPRRFTLFTSSVLGDPRLPADTSVVLLPTAPGVTDGPPVEEVLFLRDEVANMVWAVEQTVPLPDGSTRRGAEAAHETRSWLEQLILAGGAAASTDPLPRADIRYQVMTSVPENWIPFIPAREPDSDRQIRLQRAALPRIVEGDPNPPVAVTPLTMLLREGLDETAKQPYFLHETEVPREGVRVVTQFQRARWRDGRVVVWLGARKTVGRGEGSSGLAFDRIVNTPVDPR